MATGTCLFQDQDDFRWHFVLWKRMRLRLRDLGMKSRAFVPDACFVILEPLRSLILLNVVRDLDVNEYRHIRLVFQPMQTALGCAYPILGVFESS